MPCELRITPRSLKEVILSAPPTVVLSSDKLDQAKDQVGPIISLVLEGLVFVSFSVVHCRFTSKCAL